MSTEEMVVRLHRAVIAAMEAVAGGEFTVEQMQNLRADARALARQTDQKIGEMGHLVFGDVGVTARSPQKVEIKLGEEWTDVTEHVKPDALEDLRRAAEVIEAAPQKPEIYIGSPRVVKAIRDIRNAPACPRCSARTELHEIGVCPPCAAQLGWDPFCEACDLDDDGLDASGVAHVDTCVGDRKPHAAYLRGIAEGRRQTLLEEIENAESCAAALDTLDGQEQTAEFYRLQAEHFRNRLAATKDSTDG
jgi:hypothetical protein